MQNNAVEMAERLTMQFMKTPLYVQLYQALPFRHYLTVFVQFAFSVLSQANLNDVSYFETLVVRCIIFLRNVVDCKKYGPLDEEDETDQEKKEANEIVYKQIFTQQVQTNLCVLLVSKFFVLTDEELESWEKEPENFIKDEEAEVSNVVRVRLR